MNALSRTFLASRVALNQAWKAARAVYRRPELSRNVTNRYEAGWRWQYGDRSYIWSYVTDARFDATQATRIELVRKARYFEQNSPLVQRLADLWEQYVVGPNGLVISPDSSDEQWNQRSSDWFDQWAVYPDLVSLQTWSTLQSLIARTWFIDGEVFILKTRSKSAPYRPRLQLIEGHRVGTPPDFGSVNGRTVVDGVEIDDSGRPIGYHVQTGFEAGSYTFIPADQMIHIFEPARIGMYRGLTHFYATMNVLHDLDDLQRLEMQAAKDAAETTKVIKTPTGEMIDDAADWDKQTDTGNGSQNPLTEYYRRVFGASTKVMKVGDEFEQFVSQRPSVAQQWYWKYLAEEVCLGSAGVPLVLVYPDSMQGTVYRGALDVANASFRTRSAVLASAFKQIWIYVIGAGSNQDVRIADKPADWTRLLVRPPRAVNVDVGRNSAAVLAELRAGTRSWQSTLAETGDDWKTVIRQRAREAAFIEKCAKDFGTTPGQISELMQAQLEPQPTTEA